jgi:hypothetical protein
MGGILFIIAVVYLAFVWQRRVKRLVAKFHQNKE